MSKYMFQYRSLKYERFSKYDYNGQTIRLDYDSRKKGYGTDDITLIINGNQIGPLKFQTQVQSDDIADNRRYAQCELPDGKKCTIVSGPDVYDRPYSIFVDGAELALIPRDKQPKRSIEHLRVLSKHPPIASLSHVDFYALKGLNEKSVVSCPQAQRNGVKYYLKISDKAFDEKTWTSFFLPNKADFIEISNSDIQLGDDILVVQSSALCHRMQLIENVSNNFYHTRTPYIPGDYLCGRDLLDSPKLLMQTIEGSNITWTTEDIDFIINSRIMPMLEKSGLTPAAITDIFTSDITTDELDSIGTLLEHEIEITDGILQELANGADVNELVNEILNANISQNMESSEIEHGR